MQLTAKNGARLTVVRSTFATLPWPGIYVYNVTRNDQDLDHSFDGYLRGFASGLYRHVFKARG